MGVPSFYRWLAEKYPKIVFNAIENITVVDGVTLPTDITEPNPNNIEFDNLYLDMNGIIHPCSHPEDKPAPKTMDEMLEAIFEYIDRLMAIVRPRKVLYLAIDGVAPRAKMNQQRSRRFRAAKEAKEKAEQEQDIRDRLTEEGKDLSTWGKNKEERFDTNVITPGTEFMDKIARGLQYYISERITSNAGWFGLKVILSDASVPGEGEHKIMDYIRRQRIQPDYNPQTSHVLYGLDADLIMLAIATHEPHFYILRELVIFGGKTQTCNICGQSGHFAAQCQGIPKSKQGELDDKPYNEKPYQFVSIPILREYLIGDLKCLTPFKFDAERVLDDWVFLCFFVGNDFLPHLPTLKIREGAIELLMDLYRKNLPSLSGYLTNNGEVNLESVEVLLEQVGELEDAILRTRRFREERAKKNRKLTKKRKREEYEKQAYFTPTPEDSETSRNNRETAKKLKTTLYSDTSTTPNKMVVEEEKPKEKVEIPKELQDEPEIPDNVRLGEEGWKERYYLQKFHVQLSRDPEFRKQICKDYVEGLCWVMKYYYQGCASWTWYYPHHYAPFSSDLVKLNELDFKFDKGKPFRPFEQLMGVLPALSGNALPKKCHELMTDPESPIIDFYPEDFDIDMDGCRFAWQGVALLPFINEERLLAAMKSLDSEFTEEEKLRNSIGDDLLFVKETHSIVLKLKETHPDFFSTTSGNEEQTFELTAPSCDNLFGTLLRSTIGAGISKFLVSTIEGFPNLEKNAAFCFIFHHPQVPDNHVWKTGLLPNVKLPNTRLSIADFAVDKSYRFGQFSRNAIERSVQKFNDPRHQGGNRDNRNYRNDRNDRNYRNDRNDRSYHSGNNQYQNRTTYDSRTNSSSVPNQGSDFSHYHSPNNRREHYQKRDNNNETSNNTQTSNATHNYRNQGYNYQQPAFSAYRPSVPPSSTPGGGGYNPASFAASPYYYNPNAQQAQPTAPFAQQYPSYYGSYGQQSYHHTPQNTTQSTPNTSEKTEQDKNSGQYNWRSGR